MWAKSPYYVTPQLSRNTSVDVPSRAASKVSSRQPSVDSQAPPSLALPVPSSSSSSSAAAAAAAAAAVPPEAPSFHAQMHPQPPPQPLQPQQLQQLQQSLQPLQQLQQQQPSSILRPSPALPWPRPALVIDVAQLAAEAAMDSPPIVPPPASAMASKRNSAVIVEEIMRSRALARVKRTTRELRFSFAESPSTSVEVTQASRPRFHSIAHNTEFVQHRISQPTEPIKIIEIEPKVTRKPTSYYEVYPLEAYDNQTERKKRKHLARTDPRYQASLRDEFEMRKYTLYAGLICVFIFITVGGFIIWQLVQDFTTGF